MKNAKNMASLVLIAIMFFSAASLDSAAEVPALPSYNPVQVSNPNIEAKRLGYKPLKKISPDGRFFISVYEDVFSLWDFCSLQPIVSFTQGVVSAKFSSCGRCIFIFYDDKKHVDVYDLLARKFAASYNVSGSIKSIKISRDGKFLVICTALEFEVWNVEKNIRLWGACCDGFVDFTTDGKFVISQSNKGFNVSDLACGDCVYRFDNCYSLFYGANGKFLGAVEDEGLALYDFRTGQKVKDIESELDSKFCQNSNGNILAFSCDNKIRLLNLSTGELLGEFDADCSLLSYIEFSPDSRFVVLNSGSSFSLLDIELKKIVYKYNGLLDIKDVFFTADMTKIIIEFAYPKAFTILSDKTVYEIIQKNKGRILALAQALHPRCGARSMANVLSQGDLCLIYDMLGVTPWKEVFER